jgi:hypothetical protein
MPDIDVNEDTIRKYLKVKEEAPWLMRYIGDEKKGKIGITKAYDIYRSLKKKGLLDLDKRVPEDGLNILITDKYGRKVLERDDLLQRILNHELTVSQAIDLVKAEEKSRKSGKKTKKGDDEAPPTRLEIYTPKADLDALYEAMPSIKKLADEGKLTTDDAEKVYEIWHDMKPICEQASLLWYNTVDKLLKRVGLSEKEREKIFYEMVTPYFRLFPKEEIFPKEVLEGKL